MSGVEQNHNQMRALKEIPLTRGHITKEAKKRAPTDATNGFFP